MLNFDNENNNNFSAARKRKPQKKITPARLKNIGLYYLKRFESSVENLRTVLHRRADAYARENPDWKKEEAYQWIEEILQEFERLHYLDDTRYAEIKIRGYLNAGKPARYIETKLKAKGVSTDKISQILEEQEYNPFDMALKLAKRKKIGPYRPEEIRRESKQKDMATLIRAGFDYDVVCDVLNYEIDDDN
ncbi:MAG: regulatory protein RecX [Alphaproteobacteria bacterium]|nr:regulatory protein RecX [Alphaproteobacteria bacterium]